ncbi:hypothetical protein Tco_1037367, partial [Tanacetum coccineum]
MNAFSFYRMETYEISERYIAPCFVNGLEAFDGEVNLAFDENLISNEFTGELYFVKFIINPEEDDFEPGVILGKSFLRLAQEVVDFGNGVITIYPEPDPFEEDSKKTGKSSDDWDQLLDFNFDDIPKSGEELPSFAEKEELAIRISQRYALLEEERHVIETMAYNDKYKKILDEIWKDKVELDGKNVKEDKEAVKRIKGETLKEKDDPGAFIFPIRLEGKVNENALADTRSDINTMPYRIFEILGREDMKKVNRGITMMNHTQAKAMGKLSNVLCQVGVTTIIAKFLILDIPIDRDAPIVVDQGFLYTIGTILNALERIFSTFDGICHQTFLAASFDVLRTTESDSDDEETSGTHDGEAGSSRSKRPRQHETVEELLLPQVHHEFLLWEGCNRDAKSRYNTRLAQLLPRHIYSPCIVNWDVLNQMGCDGEIDDMLRIRVREAASEEEVFTSVAWIRAFNINEPIYAELCHEFYSTYEFDEVCADDELQSKKIIKFRLGGRSHSLTLLEFAHRLGLYQAVELEEDGFNVYFEGGLRSDDNFNAQDYWLSISQEDNLGLSRSHTSTIRKPILRTSKWICECSFDDCKMDEEERSWDSEIESNLLDLDTTTLRDLIDSDRKLILEDPQSGMPRVGIPRPPRASMQDLYDKIGRMEIRQEAIEHMEYRELTTHLAMLSRSMTSTISSTHLRHHSTSHRNSSRMMTSSVEMTR